MQLNRPTTFLLIPILSLSAVPAIATPAQQEQLDQSRAQEAERQERLSEERAKVVAPPPPSSDLSADESVRFHISHITIQNQTERFRASSNVFPAPMREKSSLCARSTISSPR